MLLLFSLCITFTQAVLITNRECSSITDVHYKIVELRCRFHSGQKYQFIGTEKEQDVEMIRFNFFTQSSTLNVKVVGNLERIVIDSDNPDHVCTKINRPTEVEVFVNRIPCVDQTSTSSSLQIDGDDHDSSTHKNKGASNVDTVLKDDQKTDTSSWLPGVLTSLAASLVSSIVVGIICLVKRCLRKPRHATPEDLNYLPEINTSNMSFNMRRTLHYHDPVIYPESISSNSDNLFAENDDDDVTEEFSSL